jgi:predicted metal-dependent enzyme (double-stranded beta helix superfamily)
MNDGLDRMAHIKGWKDKVLAVVGSALHGQECTRPDVLAHALSAAPWWMGCPIATDILAPSAQQIYRRISLTPAQKVSYSVLLIAWPAGHRTPVHDHDGLWGIELVLDGALEDESFSLATQGKPHLVSRGSTLLGRGDSAAFSEVDFAHRCRNLSTRQPALSLHVYGGELETFRAFAQDDRGAWQATSHRTTREAELN